MAHEIRNPLMVIGATARRMAKSETGGEQENRFQVILSSVERVEAVLREVDHFVNIPPPQKKLERIDLLIEQEIGTHRGEWAEKGFRPSFSVKTPQVLVPLDSGLFRKALSMVFQEILFSVLKDTEFPITVQNYGNEIEILFGTPEDEGRFCDPFDPGSVEKKPWTLGLFLSMAHKIVDDHGGQMLLDSKARGPFPMIVRLPRTMRA
jgi:nitrogen fixation/metabolism regulation signal transduction histidine kinase